MMGFLLFVVSLIAISNVCAVEYILRVECEGTALKGTVYCPINYDIPPNEREYYTIDLIEDLSTSSPRCQERKTYYYTTTDNEEPVVRADPPCHGIFGLRLKNPGHPYKGGCGQDNGLGFKIINGRETTACKFPWMVLVRKYWNSQNDRSSCGGSIVNERWILTAAHCIINQHTGLQAPTSAMYVRSGTLDKSADYIERKVSHIVIHQDYNWRHLYNDIALMRLSEPIKYDGCHSPVCLNSNQTTSVEKRCIISGWGRSRVTGNYWPKNLLWAYDYMYARSQCAKIYRSHSKDSTICGRSTSNGNSGFCNADSGGPLVCQDDIDGRYYQHGIVSGYLAPSPCRMEGLYTRVAYFYDWIKQKIR